MTSFFLKLELESGPFEVTELCRQHFVASPADYAWKGKSGRLGVSDGARCPGALTRPALDRRQCTLAIQGHAGSHSNVASVMGHGATPSPHFF